MFARLLLLIGGTLIMLTSCHSKNGNHLVKSLSKTIDSCTCSPDILSPPPLFGYTIAADTIICSDNRKGKQFVIRLVSDKTVDFEGETMQLFKVRLKSEKGSDSFDFSFPIKYNMYWNELHIYKDTSKKAFYIGFKSADSVNIHLLYSFSLDTLAFNKGLILKNYIENPLAIRNVNQIAVKCHIRPSLKKSIEMGPDTLEKDIQYAVHLLFDLGGDLTQNKLSKNCKYLITKIKDREINFHELRYLNKIEKVRKLVYKRKYD